MFPPPCGPTLDLLVLLHGPTLDLLVLLHGPTLDPLVLLHGPTLDPLVLLHGPTLDPLVLHGPTLDPLVLLHGPTLDPLEPERCAFELARDLRGAFQQRSRGCALPLFPTLHHCLIQQKLQGRL